MGGGISAVSSTQDISSAVKEIAPAYEEYAKCIEDNGVDGAAIFGFHDAEELLNELNIEKKLHRNRLKAEFNKLRQQSAIPVSEPQGILAKLPSSSEEPHALNDQEASIDLGELLNIALAIKPVKPSILIEDIQHIFISYRQKTELPIATNLYTGIKAMVADRDFGVTGRKPKIFWDVKSLSDGELWMDGFVKGLLSSLMIVPILSWHQDDTGSVAQLRDVGRSTSDRIDNVLLEWDLALVLMEWDDSLLKSILPIMLGGVDVRGFLPFPYECLEQLSDNPSLATKQKLCEICQQNGVPISERAIRRSVKETVLEILSNQGVKLSDLGQERIALEASFERVFDKGSALLLKVGLENESCPSLDGATAVAVAERVMGSVASTSLPGHYSQEHGHGHRQGLNKSAASPQAPVSSAVTLRASTGITGFNPTPPGFSSPTCIFQYLVSELSGKVLDVSNGSRRIGNGVWMYGKNQSPAQWWQLTSNGYLVNALSGLVLEVQNADRNERARVWMSTLCLDEQAVDSARKLAQRWRLTADGYLQSMLSDLVLDIECADTCSKAKLWMTKPNGNSSQKWRLECDGYYLECAASRTHVLDVENGSPFAGAKVWMYEKNGTKAQRWRLAPDGVTGGGKIVATSTIAGGSGSADEATEATDGISTGEYQPLVSNLGKVLEAAAATEGAELSMQPLRQQGSRSNAASTGLQRWVLLPSGQLQLADRDGAPDDSCGLVLSATGGDIQGKSRLCLKKAISNSQTACQQQETCEGDLMGAHLIPPEMCWRLNGDGFYLQSDLGTVLDVCNADSFAGARVWMYDKNQTMAQKWVLTPEGCIQSLLTGMVLEVRENKPKSGLWMQPFEPSLKPSQRWVLTEDRLLESALNGLVLDVQKGKSSAKTNLWMYEKNNTKAQRWRIVGDRYYSASGAMLGLL